MPKFIPNITSDQDNEHFFRVNHSCVPNAETSWKSDLDVMDLVAIKDIGQGEEITICYLNKVPQFKDFLLVSQQDILLRHGESSFKCFLKLLTGQQNP